MRIIIVIDLQGLVRVDLVAEPDERESAHQFWQVVKPAIEELDTAVRSLNAASDKPLQPARAG
jgi:hypothetical protein